MATATYETVLEQARQLTREDQLRLIEALEDIPDGTANDAEWERVFVTSLDRQQRLVEKLKADLEAGRTEPLDLDRL